MKSIQAYILMVMTFLFVQKSSQDNADYTDYHSAPSTDWKKAKTTPGTPATQSTTADDYYNDSGDDSQHPQVLISQGKHAMISLSGYDDCGFFLAYEDQVKEGEEKRCWPTPHPYIFWIGDFEESQSHQLVVVDHQGTQLLKAKFSSLPKKPPDIGSTNFMTGAGWILVKINVAPDPQPSLVGVEVLYKRKEETFWWSSYVESVTYAKGVPTVVPVHFCPEFVDGGTYCILLSDGLWIKNETERSAQYVFQISPFRIGPNGRTFGTATKAVQTYTYCDWLQINCNPPMGQTDDYGEYEDQMPVTNGTMSPTSDGAVVVDSAAHGGGGGGEGEGGGGEGDITTTSTTPIPLFDLSTTWAPEMWIDNKTEPPPDIIVEETELWILGVAVLIILISILMPLAFWLGTRSGYHEAEEYWTQLSSTGGNVNIALGYVGTEWTRPVDASKTDAK